MSPRILDKVFKIFYYHGKDRGRGIGSRRVFLGGAGLIPGIKTKRAVFFAAFGIFAILGAASCQREAAVQPFAGAAFSSYRDVPGITQAEIDAIAALRESREFFTYVKMESQEAFTTADGTVIGFARLLADFLSDFFGIPFVLRIGTLEEVHSSLDALTSDFASDLTPTPERRERYFMSHPIFQRQIGVFSHVSFPEFEGKDGLYGRRVGHLRMAATYQTLLNRMPQLSFQPVGIPYLEDVPAALESGYIDAFILGFPFAMFANPDIRMQILYPQVISHGSLTTANPDLDVIIQVFDRFIEERGINNIYQLYRQGFEAFARYQFRASLTEEERQFVDGLASRGAAVPVGLEPDGYPISFYDTREGQFQGIIPDFLAQVTHITGIRFEAATGKHTSWAEIVNMLKTGEVAFVSELYYLPGGHKEDLFLFGVRGERPFFRDNFILMSRVELADLQMHHVMHANVGVVQGTIYENVFDGMFPYAINVKRFDTEPLAEAALSSGEIDLLMTRGNRILARVNLYTNINYKANITFTEPLLESFIAFNSDWAVLQAVMSKAAAFIDMDIISHGWVRRYFDHARAVALQLFRARLIFMGSLVAILVVILVLLYKNKLAVAHHNKKNAIINALYMAMPDVVHYKDKNGRYIGCNRSFEEYTNLKESQIVGKTPFEVYKDEATAERHAAVDRKVLAENTVEKDSAWRRFSDGSERLYETVKAPLIVEGQTVGLLGIGRDITVHHKAVEVLKEADKKKNDFLAHMSHEIRTPMNAIMGMAELSLNTEAPPVIHEHLRTIKHAAQGLLSIINDILDFSKIEAGKFEIVQTEYSLSSLLNDVISIIRVKAEESRLRFMVNVDSKLPASLIGDDIRIRQVLLNILSNAFKYTERGYVSLFVSGEFEGAGEDGSADRESVILTFQVADTGIGIKKEHIDELFEEYSQFDLEKNRRVEGTGLGLPIAAGFIKAMGGNIRVFSEYEKGSRFTITLPQKINDRKPLAAVTDPDGKKTLVFEKRGLFSSFILIALNNLGVKSVPVSGEAEFMESLESGEFGFAFIASDEYEKRKGALEKFKGKTRFISVAELGAPAASDQDVLPMPFHAPAIAGILNNAASPFAQNAKVKLAAKFTCPKANILVVDDIITNLKVAQGLLAPYKSNVDICKSGATSVEAVKANRYDLIFMDHKMPGIDGIEATKRIRALAQYDGYFKDVPIIALTANAISGSKELFLENGFNDFLSKPIDTVKLAQILEAWLPKEKTRGC